MLTPFQAFIASKVQKSKGILDENTRESNRYCSLITSHSNLAKVKSSFGGNVWRHSKTVKMDSCTDKWYHSELEWGRHFVKARSPKPS